MDNELLRVSNIRKTFPGLVALDNVDFEVKSGEIHALLGENGAGKSTLIKILSGAYKKDAGQIELDGQVVKFAKPSDSIKAGISVIYQDPSHVDTLTVSENILLGSEYKKGPFIDRKKEREEAIKSLEIFHLEEDVDTEVGKLSVSKRQLLEIVKAIRRKAKVLILDEPTASLSTDEIQELFRVVRELRQSGIGIVFVSHQLDEVFEIADRATILRDGKKVATLNISEISMMDLISTMVDKNVEKTTREERSTSKEICLSIKNVTSNELHDISLDVRKGEIMGLAGIMGAGRTELVRIIAGVDQMSSGEIEINGKILRKFNINDAIKNGICMLSEDRINLGIFPLLTVTENTFMSNWKKVTYKFGGLISRKGENRKISESMELFNVKPRISNAKLSQLSGGNQQKVVLSRAYACDPSLLLLDEPTKGVDIAAKAEIFDLVKKLCNEGMTVILVSSEWEELTSMCDRIAVLRKGSVKKIFEHTDFDVKELMYCAAEN